MGEIQRLSGAGRGTKDAPETARRLRNNLREKLRKERFGYLQDSVWVSPDSLVLIQHTLKKIAIDPEGLALFEATTCGGERPSDIVNGAWDFDEINACYRKYSMHLDELPSEERCDFPEQLRRWIEQERRLWFNCLEKDPLLPVVLLPPGYVGRNVHKRRQKMMRQAGKAMTNVRTDFSDGRPKNRGPRV
ncbi:MAG TPA: hypothetical protein VIT91_00385 [Chthoniobacterales bacterium]